MIYEFVPNSRTSDSTEVSEISLQEYLQLVTSLYTPHPRLCPDSRVYELVYTNVHAAVRRTNTIQPRSTSKKGGVQVFGFVVLFSNSIH